MSENSPFFANGWPVLPLPEGEKRQERVELEYYDGSPDLVLACTQLPCKASRQTRIVKQWCEFFSKPNPVRRLAIVSRVSVKLFEAVCKSSDLEQLSIKWGPIKDLTPIAGLAKLTHLHFGSCSVESLSPVAELSQLREASFESLDRLSDYSPLGELPGLELLSIDGSPFSSNKKMPVDSLDFVRQLPKLRGLSIGFCKVLADQWHKPLVGLTQLEELYLPALGDEASAELLASLPNLRRHEF